MRQTILITLFTTLFMQGCNNLSTLTLENHSYGISSQAKIIKNQCVNQKNTDACLLLEKLFKNGDINTDKNMKRNQEAANACLAVALNNARTLCLEKNDLKSCRKYLDLYEREDIQFAYSNGLNTLPTEYLSSYSLIYDELSWFKRLDVAKKLCSGKDGIGCFYAGIFLWDYTTSSGTRYYEDEAIHYWKLGCDMGNKNSCETFEKYR